MRIALLSRGVEGGGVQQMFRNLAQGLAERGYEVDLLVPTGRRAKGAVPPGVRVVPMTPWPRMIGQAMTLWADRAGWRELLRPVLATPIASEALRFLPPLCLYMRADPPDALMAATSYLNLDALWARRITVAGCRILVSERDNLSQNLATGKGRAARWRHLPALIGRCYPWAEAIVAVSDGVADDLARIADIDRARITTIYNANWTPELEAALNDESPCGVDWLDTPQDRPVIVSAGRLVEKKRFDVLLDAFARLVQHRPARLVILGDGPLRATLQAQASRLGVAEAVHFAGWVEMPVRFFKRADLFALASQREGIANIVIEALAAGCLVVSTDCPSGPAEVLENGRHGRLVPVGDAPALADAMRAALEEGDTPDCNRETRRDRARFFSPARAVDAYLAALDLPPIWDGGMARGRV